MQSTNMSAERRLWKSGFEDSDESIPSGDRIRRERTPTNTAEFWGDSPIFARYGHPGMTLNPKRKVHTGLRVMPWQKKKVDGKKKRR